MIKRALNFLQSSQVESILAKGSLLAFLIQGIGTALFLLTEILVARFLGVAQFGIYSMATAWIYILCLVGALGFNHAMLKFVPIYFERQEWGALRGILRRSSLWVLIAAALIVFIGYGVLFALSDAGVDPAIIAVFSIALLIIPFQVLSSLRQAVLRSLNRIAYALLPEFIFRPLLFIFLIAVTAYSIPASLNATKVFFLNLVSITVAFTIGAYWQQKFLPSETKRYSWVYRDREWFSMALPLLLIIGLNLISSRIDIILLGMFSNMEHVGIYTAASRISDVIVFGLVSANAVVAPMIARLHSLHRNEELQRLVSLTAKGIFLFTVPIALLLVIFGKEILGLFGHDFDKGYLVLVILICGQLVNALAGPVGFLMTMTGHQAKALKIVAFAAMLNLVLNLIFIPAYGMTGAAISTSFSIATWNILMLRFVKAELFIKSSAIKLLGTRV